MTDTFTRVFGSSRGAITDLNLARSSPNAYDRQYLKELQEQIYQGEVLEPHKIYQQNFRSKKPLVKQLGKSLVDYQTNVVMQARLKDRDLREMLDNTSISPVNCLFIVKSETGLHLLDTPIVHGQLTEYYGKTRCGSYISSKPDEYEPVIRGAWAASINAICPDCHAYAGEYAECQEQYEVEITPSSNTGPTPFNYKWPALRTVHAPMFSPDNLLAYESAVRKAVRQRLHCELFPVRENIWEDKHLIPAILREFAMHEQWSIQSLLRNEGYFNWIRDSHGGVVPPPPLDILVKHMLKNFHRAPRMLRPYIKEPAR